MEKESTLDNAQPLVKNFEKNNMKSLYTPKIIALLIVVVVFGIGTGYMLSGGSKGSGGISSITGSITSGAQKGTIVGSDDTKTYNNITEGVLKEGGIEGEGTHHLERPGGDSQNVYITSSNIDFSQYIGRKVKVWGQTHDAQHAGWLMDVGRLQVL